MGTGTLMACSAGVSLHWCLVLHARPLEFAQPQASGRDLPDTHARHRRVLARYDLSSRRFGGQAQEEFLRDAADLAVLPTSGIARTDGLGCFFSYRYRELLVGEFP
jgi:hypothetical protein